MESAGEGNSLTVEQVRHQLSNLSPAAMGFLMKWAAIYAPGTGHEPDEMLHNCIVKFLSGERRAPSSCSLTTTLKNAMKSLSSNDRRKRANEERWLSTDRSEDDGERFDPVENFPSDAPPIEGDVESDELVEIIRRHLEHDEIVMRVMNSRFQGLSMHETCEQLNIAGKDYDAAVKRMRRTIDKHYRR